MKKLIVLFGLLFCAGGICSAQTKGLTWWMWSQVEAASLNEHKEFKAIELAVAPGWTFKNSIFARLQCDFTTGLWDPDGADKTYRMNVTLGPAIGYNVFKNSDWGIVEVAAAVGNTLNNKDWSYIYYDLGAALAIPPRRGSSMKMLWGLGVRYYGSHNSHFNDYCNLYAKIGFRF